MTRALACSVVLTLALVIGASTASQRFSATRIDLPAFPGAWAVWGATGQDPRGHIWIGVSAAYTPVPSAHLIEYDPATGQASDRGDVVGALGRLKLLRDGEHQAKIHSKIVSGPGGWLYFASMDEEGERENGSRLPTWGGHLWRMQPSTGLWQHLRATPEALIAVAGSKRFIYALGYFGHVLYQYDTASGTIRRREVGSVDGHITRNFFTDDREHVYVPRLRSTTPPGSTTRRVDVSLVELDADLQEVGETAIDSERYLESGNATASHGIIAFQPMADRSILFATHRGYLFRVVPPAPSDPSVRGDAAAVQPLGWLHPDGASYTPSLFTDDGRSPLSLAHPPGRFEWLTCPMRISCDVDTLVVPGIDAGALGRSALYGSATRDAGGGHYVVGSLPIGNKRYEPIVIRIAANPN